MWNIVKEVDTPIAVLALLVGVAAWTFVKSKLLRNKLVQIASAGKHQAEVVKDALESLRIDTGNLSQDQQYNIAVRLLEQRRERFRLLTLGAVVLFLSVLVVYFLTSNSNRSLQPSVERDYESVKKSPNLNQDTTFKEHQPTPVDDTLATSRNRVTSERLTITDYKKSSVYVESGTHLSVEARGRISLGQNIGDTDPNGKDEFQMKGLPVLIPIQKIYYDEKGFPLGALLIKVDSEDQWQLCGLNKTFIASKPGYIEFKVNDALKTDNNGEYKVTIDQSN